MSYEYSLQRAFVADHFHDLPGFNEARHGHNWTIRAAADIQDPAQEARFAACLDEWVQGVDYALLNELSWMSGRNPTAEVLAWMAAEDMERRGFRISWVRIQEKANYWAFCRRVPS